MSIRINERYFRNHLKAEVKRYGITSKKQQKDLDKLLDKIPTEITFNVMQEEAQKIARLVVAEIDAQPYEWPPLNEKYKKSKQAQGLREEMLRATDEYRDSIGVVEASMGDSTFRLRVGCPNKEHSTAGINLNDLGQIHENGTQTIPARPHWGPVFDRWKASLPTVINRIKDKVSKDLSKKIEKILTSSSKPKKLK